LRERFKAIVATEAPSEQRSSEYLKQLAQSETAKMAKAMRAAGIQKF
jgi:hypothetical protein